MAVVGSYTQQPNDLLDYDVPYKMAAGDSIATVTVTSVSPTTAPALSATAAAITGSKIKLWIGDGVAGTKYKVTFKVTTVQGREKEDELSVRVKDY